MSNPDGSDDLHFLDENPEIVAPNALEKVWRVLVVDDEPDVHRATKLYLSMLTIHGRKIKMTSAYTAAEACDLLANQANNFDIVLLDCVMETPDAGFEVARFVKYVLHKVIPVIVMRTGYAGLGTGENLHLHPEIDDFVSKTDATVEVMRQILQTWLPISK